MGVVDDGAVFQDFGTDCVEDIGGFKGRERRAALLAGKHDTVVSDAHFDDVRDTIFSAGFDLFFTDRAGGVCHVDGVFADAFAETLEARRGPTGFNNGCWEVCVVAEKLCDDGRVRQHGRRACNLYVVARCGSGGRNSKDRQRRGGQFRVGHSSLLITNRHPR